MLLASGDGSVTIDGLAGRCSSLGFNPVSLKETLSSVTDILLMDSGQWLTDDDEAARAGQFIPFSRLSYRIQRGYPQLHR